MEYLLPAFPVIFFLLVTSAIVALWILLILRRFRAASIWESFARERNLVFSPGGAFGEDAMHGSLDGLRFTINTRIRSTGRNRAVYTQWHVEIPGWMPQGMLLKREGLGAGLEKLFGAEDIQIGDPQLDGALMIEGNDAVGIRRLLTHPEVRPVLLEFSSSFGTFCVGSTVMIQSDGRQADPRVLEGVLRQAAQLARVLAAAARQLGAIQHPPPQALPAPSPPPPANAPAYAAVRVQHEQAPVAGYGSEQGAAFRGNARPIYDLMALPQALAPLASRELSPSEQQLVVEQARGCWHVIEMVVQRVERTAQNVVPQGWEGGRTLFGVAAGGLSVAVSYPSSHAAHIGGVQPGMSIRLQAGVILWDPATRLLRLGAV